MFSEKKLLMLVEDSQDDMELALMALHENGMAGEPVLARDGQEALNYLLSPDESHDRPMPDVLLLDLKLPRVNGLEVLKQLRENVRTRYLPVVVFSSSKEECDVKECYRLGANSYIQKSLSYSKFTDSVKQISHYWLELNEALPVCIQA